MAFEDLLRPKPPACKTCSFIEGLKPGLRQEVDAAMAKATYTNISLARALATLGDAPKVGSVEMHRERGHRR